VSAQVIHEDDIAFVQRRREDLLNIGEERWPIHRAVNGVRRRQANDAQRGNERLASSSDRAARSQRDARHAVNGRDAGPSWS